jgi:NTF2 fold immunity protein
MMKQTKLAAILMLTSAALAQAPTPKNGFIPDEATAIKVAEAILSPIYGEKLILSERPFHATLKEDIWTITGTLPKGWDFGGVATIRIDKKTGAVISCIHGK